MGPGPQCSERLAEDQLRKENLPSCSCTKFHKFLLQSTHTSVMFPSLNRHTCKLVDLTCHFPHSNVQSRFSHNWTQKTKEDAVICLGKCKASQRALGIEDQRLRKKNPLIFKKSIHLRKPQSDSASRKKKSIYACRINQLCQILS